MKDRKTPESCIKLEKFTKRINTESIIKSIMFGAIAGFTASFLFSFIGWLTGFKLWWITFIIFAAVTAAVAPVVYFKKYQPKIMDVARRLDRLGLEERVITMVELEGTNTVMAAHQSASALNALGGVTAKMLPVIVSGLICVSLGVSGVLGTGMITVHALYAADVIDSGKNVIDDIVNPDKEVFYTVRYQIVYVDTIYNEMDGSGAEIEGNEEQIILHGTDAEPVLLYIEDEPEDEGYGWNFLGWFNVLDFTESPTSEDPYRQDLAVTLENTDGVVTVEDGDTVITHYAIVKLEEMDPPPQEGDEKGEPSDDDGDDGGDTPPDEPEDPEDSDQKGEEQPGDNDDDNKTPGDGTGGGKYNPDNQIIDGNVYYRDHFEEYLEEYKKYLESGKEIPEYLQKFIEIYYDIIK